MLSESPQAWEEWLPCGKLSMDWSGQFPTKREEPEIAIQNLSILFPGVAKKSRQRTGSEYVV